MWKVQHKRTFLKELARLPKQYRERISEIAFGDAIVADPFLAGRLQQLTGYVTYYKLRVGVYRVGLHIDQDTQTITFMRVLHRKDIYRRFP